MDNIGKRIRECRLAKKMTLENLSEKLGVTAQTVQKYETGAIGNISMQNLTKIAYALEVSPSYLMGWEDENPIITIETAENKIINALIQATKKAKIQWNRLGVITTQTKDSEIHKEIRETYGSLLYNWFSGKKEFKHVDELNEYFVSSVSDNIYVLEKSNGVPNTPDVKLTILKKQPDGKTYKHTIDSFEAPKLTELYAYIHNSLLEQENKPLFDILNDLENL